MTDGFARVLKAEGFQKQRRAMIFRRTRPGGVIEVVHVRADALTAGVYFPELAYGRVTEAPQAFDCTASRTFDVVDGAGAWASHIAPWLASVTDLPSLHAALDEGGVVGPRYDLFRPARIALAMGDTASAQRRLNALIASIYAERTSEDDTFGAGVLQQAVWFANANALVLKASRT